MKDPMQCNYVQKSGGGELGRSRTLPPPSRPGHCSYSFSAASHLFHVSIVLILSTLTIPSGTEAFQCHSLPTVVHGKAILKNSERRIAKPSMTAMTTMLSSARRSGGRPTNDDDDDDDNLPGACNTGIPLLPPMTYWRVSGGEKNNDDDDKASAAGDQSLTSSSFAGAASTNAAAFVSPKFELQYTCNVCETRNRVLVSRQAYREGMVIAICKGCDSKHWIADNLGGGGINIEDHLDLLRVSTDVFQLEKVLDFTGSLRDENGNAVLE
jgi:DNL zinc finger